MSSFIPLHQVPQAQLNVSDVASPVLQTQISGGATPGVQEMGDAYKVSILTRNYNIGWLLVVLSLI